MRFGLFFFRRIFDRLPRSTRVMGPHVFVLSFFYRSRLRSSELSTIGLHGRLMIMITLPRTERSWAD